MTSRADTPLNARVIAPLVILAVWIILYAWRPWHLGFYHDDWFMARSFDVVEAERLFAQFPSRPLLVAVTLAAGRMLGADPFAWQALMVVSSLAVALLLAEVGRRLARALILDEIGAIAAGAAGACLWLALPWTLGFTVFVTAFNGLPGLLIFLGLCTLIMSRLPLWLRMTGAVSLSLALGLMFESLWGAPILMAFIPVLRRLLRDERGWVRELYVPAVLIAAQLLLLLYNRLWALAGMGQNKALDVSAAFNVFNQSLQRLSGEFGTSLVLHPTVGLALTTLVVAAGTGLWRSSWREQLLAGGVALIVVAGVMLSILIYALGGYVVETVGLNSRTTFGLAIWIALGFASLLGLATAGGRAARFGALGGATLLVGQMGLMQLYNLEHWRAAWTAQTSLLAQFPTRDYLKMAASDTMVLIEAPPETGRVQGLTAFWDTSSALLSVHPELRTLRRRPFDPEQGWLATMSRPDVFRSSWDGAKLTQGWCHLNAPLWTLPAPGGLLLWRVGEPGLLRIEAPTTFGCAPREASSRD